jgi:hypothetical protein
MLAGEEEAAAAAGVGGPEARYMKEYEARLNPFAEFQVGFVWFSTWMLPPHHHHTPHLFHLPCYLPPLPSPPPPPNHPSRAFWHWEHLTNNVSCGAVYGGVRSTG